MSHYPTITRTVVVGSPQGFHMRPAHQFAQAAQQFQAQIYVVKGDLRCDGRSIMELLTLAAPQGTELVIEAQGPDAEQAIETLARIVENPQPEEPPTEDDSPQ